MRSRKFFAKDLFFRKIYWIELFILARINCTARNLQKAKEKYLQIWDCWTFNWWQSWQRRNCLERQEWAQASGKSSSSQKHDSWKQTQLRWRQSGKKLSLQDRLSGQGGSSKLKKLLKKSKKIKLKKKFEKISKKFEKFAYGWKPNQKWK